jgi:hypothetical protein
MEFRKEAGRIKAREYRMGQSYTRIRRIGGREEIRGTEVTKGGK